MAEAFCGAAHNDIDSGRILADFHPSWSNTLCVGNVHSRSRTRLQFTTGGRLCLARSSPFAASATVAALSMVSLYELLQLDPSPLQTDTNLDPLLPTNRQGGIFEVHAVPGCVDHFRVLTNVIVNHLSQSSPGVVVIDTLHPFRFHRLRDHPRFKREWASRISHYTVNSISQLYMLCLKLSAGSEGMAANTAHRLIIINNYPELMDLYRVDMSAVYEEYLLKHQVETNNVLLAHFDQMKTEGTVPACARIPPTSDLLRQHPARKTTAHLSTMANLLALMARTLLQTIVLVGYLDSAYVRTGDTALQQGPLQPSLALQIPLASQIPLALQFAPPSQRAHLQVSTPLALSPPLLTGKVVLTPKPSPIDQYVACRLIFRHNLRPDISATVKVLNFREDRSGEIDLTSLPAANPTQLPSSPDLTASQIRAFIPAAALHTNSHPIPDTANPAAPHTALSLSPLAEQSSPLDPSPHSIEDSDADDESHLLFI